MSQKSLVCSPADKSTRPQVDSFVKDILLQTDPHIISVQCKFTVQIFIVLHIYVINVALCCIPTTFILDLVRVAADGKVDRSAIMTRSPPIGWARQQSHATKIRPKAVGGSIFGRFSNVDKCRPEVAGDVISGVVV